MEQEYNFCPNCGSSIKKSFANNSDSSELKNTDVVICSNCGEENSKDILACISCGAKLNTNRESVKTKIEKTKRDEIRKPANRNTSQKTKIKNSPPSTSASTKYLEKKKIYFFVGIAVLLVILIILLSGILDLSSPSRQNIAEEVSEQSSGIDLSAISKINDLKGYVEKNPNDANAILDLANLRFDSGFFEDASENYQQYLELVPKNADARIDMAVCYYNLQQFDKAETEIIKALEFSPNHQTGYLNLGVVYLAKQNLEKAKECFNRAVNIDPNSEIGKKANSLLQTH
ncbi:MAG: tetratricopeptide repeat protein [Ignavibacteriaceae bacterium]|nr:tetratricopeptide repeat protein [Ignavibacteriaceae bacterium]